MLFIIIIVHKKWTPFNPIPHNKAFKIKPSAPTEGFFFFEIFSNFLVITILNFGHKKSTPKRSAFLGKEINNDKTFILLLTSDQDRSS